MTVAGGCGWGKRRIRGALGGAMGGTMGTTAAGADMATGGWLGVCVAGAAEAAGAGVRRALSYCSPLLTAHHHLAIVGNGIGGCPSLAGAGQAGSEYVCREPVQGLLISKTQGLVMTMTIVSCFTGIDMKDESCSTHRPLPLHRFEQADLYKNRPKSR